MDTLHTNRRSFLRTVGAAGLAVGAAGLAGCGDSDHSAVRFDHGVASGDPLTDRVILWTRVSGVEGPVELEWIVARDAALREVVASGLAATSADTDYTVHVDAVGLHAGTTYHYGFRALGSESPVGRTRTLPGGQVERVRLAAVSCSNFPAGFFHVYREIAQRNDLDALLHLGDYIYEYARGEYASADAAALGREVLPAHELLTLDDYRQRYAQYRSDPDLQAVHAALPMIAVWDDHEIANDVWAGGAENHDPATEGDFFARRAAAIRAWHEWLPVRVQDPRQPERIYRSFDFGDLLSLHMLDTRVIGRARQLDYAQFFAGGEFDAQAFVTAMADPSRQLLGVEQGQWLQGRLAASSARWQALGQQVLMARMHLPAPVATEQIGFGAYAGLVDRAQNDPASLSPQEQAVLAAPWIPYNLDAWDGYVVARETVLQTARQLGRTLVVLSGDTHNAWASELVTEDGTPAGVEFATGSVSAPGFEEYLPNEDPVSLALGVTRLIPTLKYANTGDRGYMTVTFTPAACEADWHFVSTVKRRDYSTFTGPRAVVGAGQTSLRIA